jgi:hypothetical protein
METSDGLNDSDAPSAVALIKAFGLWSEHEIDGLAQQTKVRAEWQARSTPARLQRTSPGAHGPYGKK